MPFVNEQGNVSMTTHMPKELFEKIRIWAKEDYISINSLMRQITSRALKERERKR